MVCVLFWLVATGIISAASGFGAMSLRRSGILVVSVYYMICIIGLSFDVYLFYYAMIHMINIWNRMLWLLFANCIVWLEP